MTLMTKGAKMVTRTAIKTEQTSQRTLITKDITKDSKMERTKPKMNGLNL